MTDSSLFGMCRSFLLDLFIEGEQYARYQVDQKRP